ncbi:NUDIX domain-containing protein [Ponticaulis profundi]|uniref:NUDIX domain-containing protein n=1 Tax=Ponticaulis profundi TaxID=2665222 RepID=A0ABW1SB54_9PROT
MRLSAIRNRVFQSYFRMTRPLTLGVRAIVEDDEARVLLVRHTYVSGWYLPGGGVEKHETAEDALERELIEEAGVKLTGRPDLLGMFSNHAIFPNDHVLLYHIPDWTAVEMTSRGEIADFQFMALNALPGDLARGTKERLLEWKHGRSFSKYWHAETRSK